jgi:MarR family transcriptional regulator, lower aerobic nicotinate degradation pathway regulator
MAGTRPAGGPDSELEDLGLPDAVVQLSFAVHEILSSIAAEFDLSITQVRMLGILRDREPAMLELARVLLLEKSSVTGLVERAERRGLVTRTRSADDARVVHVRLTEHGHDVARRGADQVAQRISDLLRPLSARERAQLSKTLSRVLAAVSERAREDSNL